MHISGTEPSSVILGQTSETKKTGKTSEQVV